LSLSLAASVVDSVSVAALVVVSVAELVGVGLGSAVVAALVSSSCGTVTLKAALLA
jgi:hypothetical protein